MAVLARYRGGRCPQFGAGFCLAETRGSSIPVQPILSSLRHDIGAVKDKSKVLKAPIEKLAFAYIDYRNHNLQSPLIREL